MVTLEKVLADQYKAGTISFEAAMSRTSRADELQRLIGAAPIGNPSKAPSYAGR
jgi:twitching motility protein PilT